MVLAILGVFGYFSAAWSADWYARNMTFFGVIREDQAPRTKRLLRAANQMVGIAMFVSGIAIALISLAAGSPVP